MSVTLSSNYKEVFSVDTVEKIDELIEENYALDDILTFIDEHNEQDFLRYYEEYVSVGEDIGYDVVDEFIKYHGDVSYVEYVRDAYRGSYNSAADFAEEFTEEVYGDIPPHLVVDWEATWNSCLRYDFDFVNGYVFSSNF